MLIIGKFERPPGAPLYFAVTARGVTRAYAGEVGLLKALAEAGFVDALDKVIKDAHISRFMLDLKEVMPTGLLLLWSSEGCLIYVSGRGLLQEWFETVEDALERSVQLDLSSMEEVNPSP